MADPRKGTAREIMAQVPSASYMTVLNVWTEHQAEIDAAFANDGATPRREHARRIVVAALIANPRTK